MKEKLLGKILAHGVMDEHIKPSLDKMHIHIDNFVSESDLHGGEEQKLNNLAKKLYESKNS